MSQDWDAGRLDSDLEGVAFDTLAVRAGQHRTPEGEHGDPMFFTSSYVFRTAADAAARFAGEVPGNVYSRYTNPTVRAFEERIAALESAEQAGKTADALVPRLRHHRRPHRRPHHPPGRRTRTGARPREHDRALQILQRPTPGHLHPHRSRGRTHRAVRHIRQTTHARWPRAHRRSGKRSDQGERPPRPATPPRGQARRAMKSTMVFIKGVVDAQREQGQAGEC